MLITGSLASIGEVDRRPRGGPMGPPQAYVPWIAYQVQPVPQVRVTVPLAAWSSV